MICHRVAISFELERGFVHDAVETVRSGTGHGLSADCPCMVVLENLCLHELHRKHSCLGSHRPEAQHGFRAGRPLEEHLHTADLFLDKTLVANIPVWFLSLGLRCPVVSFVRTRSVESYVVDSSKPVSYMATNQGGLGRTVHKLFQRCTSLLAHLWKNSLEKFAEPSSQRVDGQPRFL